MNKKHWLKPSLLAASIALTACGSDDDDNTPIDEISPLEALLTEVKANLPANYAFDSKFTPGTSAVSYTGQTARNILLSKLTDKISAKDTTNISQLELFYENPGNAIDPELHGYAPAELIAQSYTVIPDTYQAISTTKNLVDKTAGNDPAYTGFFGWEEGTPADAETLVRTFFSEVTALAATDTYVDQYGRDYKQLTQKLLLGAVTFSQGSGDYLLTDWAKSNVQDGDKAYSKAEHKWDEGFGYFGAARDYTSYSDADIKSKDKCFKDSNNDSDIDVRSEVNFNNSVNCAKRDAKFADTADATEYTTEVFTAFLAGRLILNDAADAELSALQVEALEFLAQEAATVWEKCISATVVHYINDTIIDIDAPQFTTGDNFSDYAKHWSEMKGFALALQFNPNSPFRNGNVDGISIDSLKQALSLMGEAPVLNDGTQLGAAYTQGAAVDSIAAYKADLLKARDLLQKAYGFSDTQAGQW